MGLTIHTRYSTHCDFVALFLRHLGHMSDVSSCYPADVHHFSAATLTEKLQGFLMKAKLMIRRCQVPKNSSQYDLEVLNHLLRLEGSSASL